MQCSYHADKDCFYISNDFIRGLTGALTGKTYKVLATSSKGKVFTIYVEADSVDNAQAKCIQASRNDPAKIVSWQISLHPLDKEI
jgi:hypothetical protein